MVSVIAWASLILLLETRSLINHFKVPNEVQDQEKTELLDYINQMRSYLGLSVFKKIAVLSSLIINGVYIFYYLTSCLVIDIEIYKMIGSFMILDRVFKIMETFELDFDKIDYVVGSDVVIGFRTFVAITHVIITILILITNQIL